ncbi:hypothetical protein L7F22_062702 [Adiantum nelumboides]|nr:hypothetical protein [Adiantum nelumboides]
MVEGDGVIPAQQWVQGAADEAWFGTAALSNVKSSNPSPGQGTLSSSLSILDLPPVLITEIFKHLNARELSLVSCVCSLFRGLSSDSHGWKNFYFERWGNPVPGTSTVDDPAFSERSWRDLYVARETKQAFRQISNGHDEWHNNARCVQIAALLHFHLLQGMILSCAFDLEGRGWVWAICLRGQRLVSSSGSDVYSWDVETGRCLRVRAGAHHGQAYAVECSRSGHFVFSGGEDGIIRMYEDKALRKKGSERCVEFLEGLNNEPIAFWHPHSGAVYELAFEDPWLVSASGDGALAMIDIRKRSGDIGKPREYAKVKLPWTVVSTDAESPQRMLFGSKQCFYSVDIGSDRIVSAGEEQVVKVWDFSHALEIERRVQASRMIRLERRFKQKQGLQLKTKQHEIYGSVSKKDADSEGAVLWQGRGIKIKG